MAIVTLNNGTQTIFIIPIYATKALQWVCIVKMNERYFIKYNKWVYPYFLLTLLTQINMSMKWEGYHDMHKHSHKLTNNFYIILYVICIVSLVTWPDIWKREIRIRNWPSIIKIIIILYLPCCISTNFLHSYNYTQY